MSYIWRAFKDNSLSVSNQRWFVALISLDAWVWIVWQHWAPEQTRTKLNLGNCCIGKSMYTQTHTTSKRHKNGIIFGVNGMALSLTKSYISWIEINHAKRQLVASENTHFSSSFSPRSSVTASLSMEYFRGEKKPHWKSYYKVKDLYREQCHLLAYPEFI